MNTVVNFSVLKEIVATFKSLLACKARANTAEMPILRLDLANDAVDIWLPRQFVHVTGPSGAGCIPDAPVRVYYGNEFAATVRKLSKVYKGADKITVGDTAIGGLNVRQVGTEPPAPITFRDGGRITAPVVPVGTFVTHLAGVYNAASVDLARGYFAGVQLETCATTGDLVFVATDGHRLHTSHTTGVSLAGTGNVFIPSPICAAILDAWKGAKHGPLVHASRVDGSSGCTVRIGEYTYRDKVSEHGFVDWRRVVPTVHAHTVEICPNEARELAKRAMLITHGRELGAHARVKIDTVNKCITLSSVQREGVVTVECPHMTGNAGAEFGCNMAYLTEAIEHLVAPGYGPCTISYTDTVTPVLMQTHARQVVIMPVRI